MEINKFSKVFISTESVPDIAVFAKIPIFLADVTADDVLNWETTQVTKSYGKGEVGNDFPSTSRAYKFAEGVFKQNPVVNSIIVGRRDPDQSVADAMSVIEKIDNTWYALIGTRGLTDILSAANWIEARDHKIHFCCSYDQDIGTTSDQSIAAVLKGFGYQRTVFFYNNQAGYQFPAADLTLTTTDGVCEAVVANGPQTEKVAVDAVVEAFEYTIDIDGEEVSYTTAENYDAQINKITVLRATNSFVYRLTIAGVIITYTATVPTDTEIVIKDALKVAINADVVLQQKMGAIDDPEDVNSLRLVGKEKNVAYEVLAGENLLNTPITVLVAPTQSEIAAILHQKLLENPVINALAYITIVDGGESIQVVVKDKTDTYTMAVSANLTKTVIVFDYDFQIGDSLTVFGADDLKLNGNAITTAVPAPNKFQFDTNAANGVATGDIIIDYNFVYPDGHLAGMGLAYPNGALDWAHEDIIGVRPETDEYLTNEVINNLEANNVNWFHVTAGERLFWQGTVVSGLFIDTVTDGLDFIPVTMEYAIFRFLTNKLGKSRLPMSDATMGSLKATMDQILENEGKLRGITAPFLEDRVAYPETGFPPGARAGDHYVSRVPRVSDIPLADRANRRVVNGVEFEFQTAGGLHVVVAYGTLKQ